MPYNVGDPPDSLGHDLFVLNQIFAMPGGAYLPNGEHSLVVRATDVNGNSAQEAVSRFVIQRPELIYGYVDPPSGDEDTDFHYYVYYHNPAGDAPLSAAVNIDGVDYPMTLFGGTETDGSYVAGPFRLGIATHHYFFEFTDAFGGLALLPETGTSFGPTVASYALIATVEPSGSGTITGAGMDCGSICSASYAPGTEVTLTATPGSGSIFTGWNGCDSADGTTCTVTMSLDRNVKAKFAPFSPVGLEWAKYLGGDSSYDMATSIGYLSDGGSVVAGYDGSGASFVMRLDAGGSPQWRKTYGGYDEELSWIQQSTDGSIFLAGNAYSSAGSGWNLIAVKLGADGTVTWQKTYGGNKSDRFVSAVATSDGGLALAGYTYSYGVISLFYADLFIVKLRADGTVQWQKAYGGDRSDGANSIQQTGDGGYVVAGMTSSFPGTRGQDAWILKLDAVGAVQWEKSYGGGLTDEFTSLVQTSDGGYIAVSSSSTMGGAGWTEAWVVKLDSTGAIEWQKAYGGSNDDYAYAVQQAPDGGYIVAGATYSFGAGGYDAWILKLDSTGTVEWEKTYGAEYDDILYSLQAIPGGGYIATGIINSQYTWVLRLDDEGNIGDNCLMVGTSSAAVTGTGATAVNSSAVVKNANVAVVATNLGISATGTVEEELCAVQAPNIVLSPDGLNFGSVNVGGGFSRSVSVVNRGDSPLAVSAASLAGANASEFAATNNCTTVSPGGSCDIAVSFNPASPGPKNATLTVYSDDPAAPAADVALWGVGGVRLAVTKSGSGTGTITSSPAGISCGDDCAASFDQGGEVLLTAEPDESSVFAGWSGTACSGMHDCTVTLSSAPTVTVDAVFEIKTFTVTPSAGPGGSISPDTPQTVNYGSITSFAVAPYAGYVVDSVTGCNGTLLGDTYDTGPIMAACTVYAVFAAIPPVTDVTLSADPAGSQVVGELVTFTAAASGGSGAYEYRFLYKLVSDSNWTVATVYGPSDTWIWDTGGLAFGSYKVQVQARSVGSVAGYEAFKTLNYTLDPPPVSSVLLTADPAGSQVVGAAVTLAAAASGGSGTYEYRLLYKLVEDTNWTVVAPYGPLDTWTGYTDGLAAGDYMVKVQARNVGSAANYEAFDIIYYALIPPPVSSVTLVSDPAGSQVVGEPVTFTASASGGSGEYEYRFLCKLAADSTWTVVRVYNSSGTWICDTSDLVAGDYQVKVQARNAGSTAAYEADTILDFTLE